MMFQKQVRDISRRRKAHYTPDNEDFSTTETQGKAPCVRATAFRTVFPPFYLPRGTAIEAQRDAFRTICPPHYQTSHYFGHEK